MENERQRRGGMCYQCIFKLDIREVLFLTGEVKWTPQ